MPAKQPCGGIYLFIFYDGLSLVFGAGADAAGAGGAMVTAGDCSGIRAQRFAAIAVVPWHRADVLSCC